MSASKWLCGIAALLVSFSLSGCDAGDSSTEVVTNQSELEAFLAENPNVEEGLDTGEEEEPDD